MIVAAKKLGAGKMSERGRKKGGGEKKRNPMKRKRGEGDSSLARGEQVDREKKRDPQNVI